MSVASLNPKPDDARQMAIAFMKKPVTTRLEIARALGLDEGLNELSSLNASLEVCRRVRRDGRFEDFARALGLPLNPKGGN